MQKNDSADCDTILLYDFVTEGICPDAVKQSTFLYVDLPYRKHILSKDDSIFVHKIYKRYHREPYFVFKCMCKLLNIHI